MTASQHDYSRTQAALERTSRDVVALASEIYENPEISSQEYRAAGRARQLLADTGFVVSDVSGAETGFVARRDGNGPGPVVGLLAEYDALPEVGHGCGHHLIAGSAIGASIAVADALNDLPGTVKVFGCPAEETGEGKPAMLAAGAFDDVDVAFTFHAHHSTTIMTSSNGVRSFEFEFEGTSSHAATDPWVGASALDGVLLTYQNLNALRQFTKDGVRLHGIITHGGDAFNVIPEYASCRLAARAVERAELERVVARVTDCARAAALASATALSIHEGPQLDPVRHNPVLADLQRESLRRLGESVDDWDALASTDFGNVSHALPAVLFSVATWPTSVAFHTREAARYAGQPRAYAAMLTGAQAMAMAVQDVLADPDVVKRAAIAHHDDGGWE